MVAVVISSAAASLYAASSEPSVAAAGTPLQCGPVPEEDVEVVVELIERRSERTDVELTKIGVFEGAVVFEVSGRIDDPVAAELCRPPTVEIRPVLYFDEPQSSGSTEEPVDTASLNVVPSLPVPGLDRASYELGPGLTLGPVTAEVVTQGSSIAVAFDIPADQADAFNDIAEQCFSTTETCPHGRVAIVFEGVALTAPRVDFPRLESVSIVGEFTAEEAGDLASALNSTSLIDLHLVASTRAGT